MAKEITDRLNKRMRSFSVDVIKVLSSIPASQAFRIVSDQLIRSSCSAASNYRASQRPRSTADMIAKLKIVEEELDGSMHWMQVLIETEIASKDQVKAVYIEANELLSITVASIKSLRLRTKAR